MIKSSMINNKLFIKLLALNPDKFNKIINELRKVYSEDTILFIINKINSI